MWRKSAQLQNSRSVNIGSIVASTAAFNTEIYFKQGYGYAFIFADSDPDSAVLFNADPDPAAF